MATGQEKKGAIDIAKDLKEWFNYEGIKNLKTDFKLNNVVIAKEKGKIFGFICYSSNSGKMQLLWMAVRRGSQNRGIGQKLLKWLEEEAKKFKLHLIEVETLSDKYKYFPYNKTRDFYYKSGFKKAFYKKARFEGWDDQVVLEKTLN